MVVVVVVHFDLHNNIAIITSRQQIWRPEVLETPVSHASKRILVSGGPRRSSSRSRSMIDSKRSFRETNLRKRPAVKDHERAVSVLAGNLSPIVL